MKKKNKQPEDIVIAIDGGTNVGIAVYSLTSNRYTQLTTIHILDSKQKLPSIIQAANKVIIVYEKIPSGLAGSLTVNFAVNLILNLIKSEFPRKCKFVAVTPSTWQSWQKKRLGKEWKQKEPKANSIKHFELFAPDEISAGNVTDHATDAFSISEWYLYKSLYR